MVGEDIDLDDEVTVGIEETNYIMCVYELPGEDIEANLTASEVTIGLVAIHPPTGMRLALITTQTYDAVPGDIIYDEFKDNLSRTELDTRISHIQVGSDMRLIVSFACSLQSYCCQHSLVGVLKACSRCYHTPMVNIPFKVID